MGQEITTNKFSKQDLFNFNRQLKLETVELQQWFENSLFSFHKPVAGYEMEAWLIDQHARPAVCNEQFLNAANNSLYTAELAQFNIELNSHPMDIQSKFLSEFEKDFQQHWLYCQTIAQSIDCRILSTGILPTLRSDDLSMDNLSRMTRYQALNEQVLKQRQGRDFQLRIKGHQFLESTHQNVMLEAAATSLQIHLQVPLARAHHYYNASLLVSAPMVAISANSPYLFTQDLWAETRIPLFEQAVEIGGYMGAAQGPIRRVSFGTDFARHSLMECFVENLQHYPVLLPEALSENVSLMQHLSLHNGTIWRWNRPLVGFDKDGSPHLRIEHRVIPAGPSVTDNIANMAFYFGLVEYYATLSTPPTELLSFSDAKDNFYTSARLGMENKVSWPGCPRCEMRHLILHKLIDYAEQGLQSLHLDSADIDYYLGIIQARAEHRKTGSHWQREFISKQINSKGNSKGNNMSKLLETYYHNQQTGQPVHLWDYQSYV